MPSFISRDKPIWSTGTSLRRAGGAVACGLVLLAQPSPVQAESSSNTSEVVVLRAGDARLPLASEIDRALLAMLIDDAGFASSYFSEIPLEDARLLSGCSEPARECLGRLTAVLGGQRLLLRELVAQEEGRVRLILSAQDGVTHVGARRVEARFSPDGSLPVRPVLRDLIRDLYAPGAAASTDPEFSAAVRKGRARAESSPALRIIGWSAAAAGSSLLVSGLVLGVLSRRAHDDYQGVDKREPEDVERARDLLDRSRAQATSANRCFTGGASLLAMGLGLLLVDYTRVMMRPDHGIALSLATPTRRFEVKLSGRFGGGR